MAATRWIEIPVVLDPQTLSLAAFSPAEPIPFGHPVRWLFRRRLPDGDLGPLPNGWAPMLYFNPRPRSTGGPYGPFESLLQTTTPCGAEDSWFEVVGEWPAAGDELEFQHDSYHAVLHRGVGFDSGKSFSILSTEATKLSVGAPSGERFVASPQPSGHTESLSVSADPASGNRLLIEPASEVKTFTNTTVTWRFELDVDRLHPLILFYHFAPDGSAARRENTYVEPCRQMRFRRSAVEASGFSERKGAFFYEAALMTESELSFRFLSTGDPKIDNEGVPFPLAPPR